eukprot:gnl/TRDRNA2_/TRDRNA2_33879_c0_seq1.p1 gnl/TRDRNA2_/TRDRNA2_33879_c0~~gnl/TRDRNA2_/TRDRNA2_33879_c0_seq1.p1  ORF type:complete len:421 (-),score=78.10 gnl/TRDRNA2_/TRDRNA2_33879_c0_seq1:75-1337(-)
MRKQRMHTVAVTGMLVFITQCSTEASKHEYVEHLGGIEALKSTPTSLVDKIADRMLEVWDLHFQHLEATMLQKSPQGCPLIDTAAARRLLGKEGEVEAPTVDELDLTLGDLDLNGTIRKKGLSSRRHRKQKSHRAQNATVIRWKSTKDLEPMDNVTEIHLRSTRDLEHMQSVLLAALKRLRIEDEDFEQKSKSLKLRIIKNATAGKRGDMRAALFAVRAAAAAAATEAAGAGEKKGGQKAEPGYTARIAVPVPRTHIERPKKDVGPIFKTESRRAAATSTGKVLEITRQQNKLDKIHPSKTRMDARAAVQIQLAPKKVIEGIFPRRKNFKQSKKSRLAKERAIKANKAWYAASQPAAAKPAAAAASAPIPKEELVHDSADVDGIPTLALCSLFFTSAVIVVILRVRSGTTTADERALLRC